MDQQINRIYREFYSKYSAKQHRLKKKMNFLAIARVLVFVSAIYAGYLLIKLNVLLGIAAATALLAIFIILVISYLKNKDAVMLINNLMGINTGEIEALRGNISNFPGGEEFSDFSHNYSNDLEIFGERSLFQFLNRTCTYAGKNNLAHWLRNPLKSEAEITDRQKSLHELSEHLSWRQQFLAIGQKLSIDQYNDTQLIAWSKEQPMLSKSIAYQTIRWVLPAITLIMMGLLIYGSLASGYLVLMLLLNVVVYMNVASKITYQHRKVTEQIPALRNYSQLLTHLENQNYKTDYLQKLKSHLLLDKHKSSRIIRKLFRISDALDNRYNMLAAIMMNLFFMWDIHQVIRLEKWHKHYAKYIEGWIETIGIFDAMMSLANYRYNYPAFVFPKIKEKSTLQATGLGHPLINEDKRVTNDFYISKKGDIRIITGANMAGKSTFLRTIGVNLVLGMMGAPVCAGQFECGYKALFTSMNITDSLSKNESYFYAEITRLRQLIDQAMHPENMLVLLDEILTGTNTRDKEKASKAFLERLIKMQVTSIIATHDLSLTNLEEKYPDCIYNQRFEVKLENGNMHYDYRLKDGIAQNMNALELLKQMNLI